VSYSERSPQAFAEAVRRSHDTTWVSHRSFPTRGMRDFGTDLSTLVLQALAELKTGARIHGAC